MESLTGAERDYPGALVEWAGHHSGGVKRLFDPKSGRPGGEVLQTNLLARLKGWARQLSGGQSDVPRIILLVGGPGNGKTEAIESTIRWLGEELGCEHELTSKLSRSFHPAVGLAVPRVVKVDVEMLCARAMQLQLSIVQDASVRSADDDRSPAQLLIGELDDLHNGPTSNAYLCCVNRGILDDALIHALENDLESARKLIEAITRAVSLAPDAPSCWPLQDYPAIAVWPMDSESLLVPLEDGSRAPFASLIETATSSARWPLPTTCVAGAKCPFCGSRNLLSREAGRDSLLRVLRWYELASGKRWSFRDGFSLLSYLLAGHRPDGQRSVDPCHWAAQQIELDSESKGSTKRRKSGSAAIFHLVAASYQHALFHRWDKDLGNSLRRDVKDLGIDDDVLAGLLQFLRDRKSPYLPATIATLLESVSDLLDPAMASSDTEVPVSTRSSIILRDLDASFSHSVEDGVEFVRKYQVLPAIEMDLLKRLAAVDSKLMSPSVRRKKPSSASRIQRTLRDFACRLVRRSICTRHAVVQDGEILGRFQKVVEDDEGHHGLFEVAQQVEQLLNNEHDFEVSLTTTFGQPLPPKQRQATLVVPSRRVGTRGPSREGRPKSPLCFLDVGEGASAQPIALTYDLFKAVMELERGLSPSSLPRAVVALLDTIRARLSGPIVRDSPMLQRAFIRIGTGGTVIGLHRGDFVSRKEGKRT